MVDKVKLNFTDLLKLGEYKFLAISVSSVFAFVMLMLILLVSILP